MGWVKKSKTDLWNVQMRECYSQNPFRKLHGTIAGLILHTDIRWTWCLYVCHSDHRHSSHHARHHQSKHTDGRRNKTGKKKRSKERHTSDDLSVQDGEKEEETHTDKPESETQDSVQVLHLPHVNEWKKCVYGTVRVGVGVCHSNESNWLFSCYNIEHI